MPFAPLDGRKIHYEVQGDPGRPVLVLSNSLGTDLSIWDAQISVLSEYFQVLRYDSFGHGQSTFREGEHKFDLLGSDVVTLLDHLKISKAHFCGISVGGMVGQWLALNAGSRLDKIVLCNTAARIGTLEGWNARMKAVEKGGMASISQAILDRWFTASFHERDPATVDRFRKMIEATPPDSYATTCTLIRDSDFRAEVPKIRAEALVIAGRQDKATPPEDGRYLAERIPDSRYVELDTAHLSNVEMPRQFSEEVLKFLAR